MSDHDAAQTEKEMREHEREARERNPDERSADDTQDAGTTSGMADGVTGDKEDPDDMAPPGSAGRMSGG